MQLNEEQLRKALEEYLTKALQEVEQPEEQPQPQAQAQAQTPIQAQTQIPQQQTHSDSENILTRIHYDPVVVEDKIRFKIKYENDKFTQEYFDTIYMDAVSKLMRDFLVYGKPEFKSFMDYLELARQEKLNKLSIMNKPVEQPVSEQVVEPTNQKEQYYLMKDYYNDYIKFLELTTQPTEEIYYYHPERRDLPMKLTKGKLTPYLTKEELMAKLDNEK